MDNNNNNLPPKPRDTNFYYRESDFKYDVDILKNFYSFDSKQKITLYRIDVVSLEKDIYGEGRPDDKKILPPIDVFVKLEAQEVENEYLEGTTVHNEIIKLKFSVFISELKEKNCENIKVGDFCTYHDGETIRIFEITMVSQINTNNTAYGYKPFYKNIECILSKQNTIKI